MADIGALRSLAKSIPDATTRSVMLQIIELGFGGLTFGAADSDDRKATNFRLYHTGSTTAASTGLFTVAHGMDTTPHLAIPVLDLSQPGATLVPVEVVRAADGKRLYLKSTSTGARVSFLVE